LAVIVGGTRWHGHDLRDRGFRQYLRDHAPRLTALDTIVNLETRQLTYEAVGQLVARRGDLRGIYVAGGGMEGAIAALRDAGAQGRVALVVSALTPESRRGLRSGHVTMAIDTPLEKLCRELISRMAAVVPGAAVADLPPLFLAPDIHVGESV
jgi:LacI family transcriptional regulator